MAVEEKDQGLRERLHVKAVKDGEEEQEHEAQAVSHMEKIKLYKKIIKECLEWVRLIVVSTIAGLIIVGLIYNFFASTEKDIPEEVFQKLYKFMQVQGAENLPAFPFEIPKSEWPQVVMKNETSN